jgi:hypothetical protein
MKMTANPVVPGGMRGNVNVIPNNPNNVNSNPFLVSGQPQFINANMANNSNVLGMNSGVNTSGVVTVAGSHSMSSLGNNHQ